MSMIGRTCVHAATCPPDVPVPSLQGHVLAALFPRSAHVRPRRPSRALPAALGALPVRQVPPGHARFCKGTCLSVSSFRLEKTKARCICLYISESIASEGRCLGLLNQGSRPSDWSEFPREHLRHTVRVQGCGWRCAPVLSGRAPRLLAGLTRNHVGPAAGAPMSLV